MGTRAVPLYAFASVTVRDVFCNYHVIACHFRYLYRAFVQVIYDARVSFIRDVEVVKVYVQEFPIVHEFPCHSCHGSPTSRRGGSPNYCGRSRGAFPFPSIVIVSVVL